MKKLLLLGLFLIGTMSQAQTISNTFVSGSIDPSMLISGPGHSYDETSTLDYEVRIGTHLFDNIRIWTAYQNHAAIDFSKISVGTDYKLNFNKWNFYAGIEVAEITRTSNDTKDITPFRFGVNGEAQFQISKTFALFAKYNVGQTEEVNQQYKDFRTQGHIGLTVYIF